MKHTYIDINCDVGEGIGNEAALLPFISSCNIACGGHTGDDESMTHIVNLAKQFGVLVGAHPSYPDKKHFGRYSISMEPNDLIRSIQDQMNNLETILAKQQVSLHHIKPHGALYNDLAKNKVLATSFLRAIVKYKDSAFLYAPKNSSIANEALKQGFKVKFEAFADRNYNSDLSLVSRKSPNALITKPIDVLNHLVKMVDEKKVKCIDGAEKNISADTYCLHGDTPNALQIIMYLSKELPKRHIHFKK